MFAAGKTATVSGAAPDDKFNYVTMLLHGDGTNGAQNNTFIDSSTNAFSITRNGNTTQGSFSPYGSNWSNFLNGSSSLSTSSSAISYAGNFTVECWFNTTTTTTYAAIYSDETSSTGGTILINNGSNDGQITVYLGSISNFASTSTGLNDGKWHHVALSRSSSTVRLFIDGALQNTTTASGTLTTPSTFRIGNWFFGDRFFGGYISNFRVTNTAVYTSSFTPSTTPLTAISGTSLLTCQSNRFIDNSTNNFAITVAAGSPSVQRFNPFGTSTAYSTSVIGGSGYFDGTGDYLQIADSSAFTFGSGDFTVEFWIYSSNTSLALIIGQNNGTETATSFDVRYNGTTISGNIFSSATNYAISESMSKNAWHHVAFVRNGTSLRIYVDGVSTSSTAVSTVSVNDSSNVLRIGVSSEATPAYYLNGYLSNVRIVKGTAVYTSNFTPSTTPLTAITNTSLLTNFTNGAIFDNAMMSDLETAGNAQISTSVKKYGTGSLKFDGSGDWLIMPYGPTQNFGTGAFTIEGWFYLNSLAASYYVPAGTWGSGTSDEWLIQIQNNGSIRFLTTSGSTFYSASITTATWYHIAIVRSGSTVTIYVNGTSVGSYTCSNSLGSVSKTLYIGSQAGTWDWNGYIDDFRITNGYARYTTTFTPPTAAFSDTGPY